MTAFTSEDYVHWAEALDWGPEDNRTNDVVLTALRIAARVMTPGVIEEGVMTGMRRRGAGKHEIAAAIRAALTEDKSDG